MLRDSQYSYLDLTRDSTGPEPRVQPTELLAIPYDNLDLTAGSMGPEPPVQGHSLVAIPYGNFEIVIRLSEDKRFLGVAELRIKKDFLSPEQRVANTGVFDVDEFYRE